MYSDNFHVYFSHALVYIFHFYKKCVCIVLYCLVPMPRVILQGPSPKFFPIFYRSGSSSLPKEESLWTATIY